jgi:hypothetical protein
MFKLTALTGPSASSPPERMHIPAPDAARFSAPARHLMRVGKVRASERETGPTITAVLEGGALGGRRIEVDVVEGRPPKPGSTDRGGWMAQSGA